MRDYLRPLPGRPVLRLRAGFPCRWSVRTRDGRGWCPPDTVPARDRDGRPYFHGDDVVLPVPHEPVTVRAARGPEYADVETTLLPGLGETLVELTPPRRYDAGARGWYGGDLHVPLNRPPGWVAAAQHGEDLNVINVPPGDGETLERWSGRDLPWSDGTHVARVDLVHEVLGLGSWPLSGVALRELHRRGTLVTYANACDGPAETADQLMSDGDPGFDARLAVVDAALGLVDGFPSPLGSPRAYRRLIGAGNRVAAMGGGSRRFGPIGRERTYARVDGRLTAGAYAEAVRQGRTFVTTGPFLELEVAGRGPGDTLDLAPGATVPVTVRVLGDGAERVRLLTADGVLASGTPTGRAGGPSALTADLSVVWPTYVVAVVEGGGRVLAHSSPVYLDVCHRRVAREEDVTFCLRWLDLLEKQIRDRVTEDDLEVLEEARRVYLARQR
ncbi:CehA/McbA family metallohydrolase [Nonomuraea sp. NPDC048826]|uniref:CehA/McbA family metallohydrolase n=1 Tax=Nonomuraea sp. NPDC048826 TaxID=3364347 RepID=UPI003719A320